MTIFSKTYLDELIAEHRLVSASIGRLGERDHARYVRTHGHMSVDAALADLARQKIQLEAKIDTLSEYLNG